jgi:hypothetical protein
VGKEYDPDMVLYSLFVGNDFSDVFEGGTGRYLIRERLLVAKQHAHEMQSLFGQVNLFLKRHSALAQHIATRYWTLRNLVLRRWFGLPVVHEGVQATDETVRAMLQIHLRETTPDFQKAIDTTLGCLDEMVAFCRAHHCRLLVQVIPRNWQIYQRDYQELVSSFHLNPSDLDMDRAQRLLGMWAKSQDPSVVHLLDLLPSMRAMESDRAPRMYYLPNAHWNVHGHRHSAAMLAPLLESYRLGRQ